PCPPSISRVFRSQAPLNRTRRRPLVKFCKNAIEGSCQDGVRTVLEKSFSCPVAEPRRHIEALLRKLNRRLPPRTCCAASATLSAGAHRHAGGPPAPGIARHRRPRPPRHRRRPRRG